ncbi:MAG: hypothetical protein FGM14_16255 [Flavobacteriales bacterium]|nr:hypothetical protein [Flavobacteriales bacterium]
MNKLLVLFLFLAISLISRSQVAASIQLDSLKISYKTGGTLDSVDRISLVYPFSFATNNFPNFQFLDASFFLNPEKGILFSTPTISNQLHFTALPHIGFSYVFGTQGTQLLNFNYQQAFKHNFIVNAAIKRNQTQGIYRNSAHQNNLYDLKIGRIGKVHTFLFSGLYANESSAWNGGVLTDSLVNIFAPSLIPVRKENALSTTKNRVLNLKNHLRLAGDSVNFLRLQLVNNYSSQQRTYAEDDSLMNLYSIIYIDSISTNDTLNTNRFNNSLSVFLKNKTLSLKAGANLDFWNYRAFAMKRDTTELGIFEQIAFQWKDYNVKHKGSLNLVGAGRGFAVSTSVSVPVLRGILAVSHQLNYTYPELFQRHFFANNATYQLTDLELQKRQQLKISLKDIVNSKGLEVYYSFVNYKDNYFFDNNQLTWRNDFSISSGTFHQIGIQKPFRLKQIYFLPSYVFNGTSEEFRVIPLHQLNARLMFKGGIFKAKKLKFACGFDLSLHSKFKSSTFLPYLSIFDLNTSTNNPYQNALFNASFFSSFEVETFHFFVRADNFAYFWSNKVTSIVQGYTLPNTQIKVGITWDFWN